MRIKVQGGTARAGESPLCSTCRHATVVKGIRLRDSVGLFADRPRRDRC